MTEQERQALRLNARIAALERAMGLIVRSLSADKSQRESLRRCISEERAAGIERTARGSKNSDQAILVASENHEAFEVLAKSLLKHTAH